MSIARVIPFIAGAALVTACTGSRTCENPQPYEAARPGPDIKAPDGLDDLRAERRIEIPEPSRRHERAEGERCLDFPPVLRTSSDDDE